MDSECALFARVAAVLAVMLSVPADRAVAQCTDGTPRNPDGSCGVVRAVRAIDPDRVAILPFRATALAPSQYQLGVGIAELLAAEFNGEIGPTAVEAVEAYRAWAAAGGEKGPLTRAAALRVAGQLGAGQLIEGAIIYTGTTFTITASMLHVPDGAVQGAPVKLEVIEDSLHMAPAALATRILGTTVGITASVPAEAQRAYLGGMALYRKNLGGADSMFLRAMRIDSTFIHPVFRMVVLNALQGPQVLGIRGFQSSFRILWRRRQQLSHEQRTLLEAVADSARLRLRVATLPRMERAMPLLQNSAEAWEILGNGYYNTGALLGRDDWLEQSKKAYQKVVQLDPTLRARAYERLAGLAFVEGDARSLTKYSSGTPWERYEAAILKGDPVAIQRARSPHARELSETFLRTPGYIPYWLNGSHLPAGEADSLLRLLEPLAISDSQRVQLNFWLLSAAIDAGRPARAAELTRRAGLPPVQAGMIEPIADDSALSERLFASVEKGNRNYAMAACETGLARLRRGDTTGVAGILGEIDPTPMNVSEILARQPLSDAGSRALCPQILRAGLASFQQSETLLLLRADSLMRHLWYNLGDKYNYDLALAFGRRGDYAMAASAARRQVRWIGGWTVPRRVPALRYEGRWAALAGDTTRAIRAYSDYLKWRSDPEPVLVPQRDSVRMELAAILSKRRPAAKPARKP